MACQAVTTWVFPAIGHRPFATSSLADERAIVDRLNGVAAAHAAAAKFRREEPTMGRFSHNGRLAKIAIWTICVGLISVVLVPPAHGQGAAAGFAVLSSSDVTLKNRVNINAAPGSPASCPGAVGCPGSIGATTVLMGRGNAAAPDMISGDVLASATAAQGLNCANNPPGSTSICLGNDSEVAGLCATGGGAVSSPDECAAGSDTTGGNPKVTALPQAAADAASLSATLAALAATQTLPAILLGTRGTLTINSAGGQNVVNVPSISSGTNSTITIQGAAADTFVINVGNGVDSGSLQLGNGSSVVLSGGITPDHVLFNLLGSGASAQLGNHTVFNGTVLAPQGQFTSGDGATPDPVLINGALWFGGSISIGNNTNLNFFPFAGGNGGGGTTGPVPTT
jgi:choice-of-anchor A domain-containing protein